LHKLFCINSKINYYKPIHNLWIPSRPNSESQNIGHMQKMLNILSIIFILKKNTTQHMVFFIRNSCVNNFRRSTQLSLIKIGLNIILISIFCSFFNTSPYIKKMFLLYKKKVLKNLTIYNVFKNLKVHFNY
jgi:hypothetical protein